jgi:hypothetical protein
MKTVTTLQTTDNAIEQFYQKLLKSPAAQAQLKTASNPGYPSAGVKVS